MERSHEVNLNKANSCELSYTLSELTVMFALRLVDLSAAVPAAHTDCLHYRYKVMFQRLDSPH